jgi:hypothetical protein
MTWMHLLYVAVGVLLAAGGLYARWYVRQMMAEDPSVHANLVNAPPPGEVQVQLTLEGTRRVFALRSVETSRETASSLGLEVPHRFREMPVCPEPGAKAVDRHFLSDWNSENLRWVPQGELTLKPGKPYTFCVGVSRREAVRGTLRFQLGVKAGTGGRVLMVPVRIGLSAGVEAGGWTDRPRLRRESGLRSVPLINRPGWSRAAEKL